MFLFSFSDVNNIPNANQQIKLINEVVYVIGPIKKVTVTKIKKGNKNNLFVILLLNKNFRLRNIKKRYLNSTNIVPNK